MAENRLQTAADLRREQLERQERQLFARQAKTLDEMKGFFLFGFLAAIVGLVLGKILDNGDGVLLAMTLAWPAAFVGAERFGKRWMKKRDLYWAAVDPQDRPSFH